MDICQCKEALKYTLGPVDSTKSAVAKKNDEDAHSSVEVSAMTSESDS